MNKENITFCDTRIEKLVLYEVPNQHKQCR